MKNFLIFILFLLVLGFLLYVLFFYTKIELINRKQILTEEIEKLKKEYVFLSFKVLGQDEDNSVVSFELYGFDGVKVTNFILTNRGRDVFIESKVIVLKKSNLVVFPWKIYSDVIAPENGVFIGDYYAPDGEVMLYKSSGRELFNFINSLYSDGLNSKNEYIENIFIAVLHTVNGVKTGRVYECMAHINGGLELREVEYE
ncbi:MAG: hypothetical protein N2258_05675 [Brevinematales bacterium]|nr:hypothetical protein [Brevinematales bacterium]